MMRQSFKGVGRSLVLLSALMMLSSTTSLAWGRKGHSMAARVAVRALPVEVPAFLRNAVPELGYLCNEADFWRNREREPALTGLHTYDHTLRLENITRPLPENRFDFLLQYVDSDVSSQVYRDLGFAPYAIAEYSEMLTANFRLWRSFEDTGNPRIRNQLERDIVHIAGLLCHFVTDTAQPLHTTIHTNGWVKEVPNPRGFEGPEIHRRFESDFVNQALEEEDFEQLLEPARVLGTWLQEAMAHIRESHQYVQKVYSLDQQHPFASGSSTPEAVEFTAKRLADAAQSIRDFWYTAWIKSGETRQD